MRVLKGEGQVRMPGWRRCSALQGIRAASHDAEGMGQRISLACAVQRRCSMAGGGVGCGHSLSLDVAQVLAKQQRALAGGRGWRAKGVACETGGVRGGRCERAPEVVWSGMQRRNGARRESRHATGRGSATGHAAPSRARSTMASMVTRVRPPRHRLPPPPQGGPGFAIGAVPVMRPPTLPATHHDVTGDALAQVGGVHLAAVAGRLHQRARALREVQHARQHLGVMGRA